MMQIDLSTDILETANPFGDVELDDYIGSAFEYLSYLEEISDTEALPRERGEYEDVLAETLFWLESAWREIQNGFERIADLEKHHLKVEQSIANAKKHKNTDCTRMVVDALKEACMSKKNMSRQMRDDLMTLGMPKHCINSRRVIKTYQDAAQALDEVLLFASFKKKLSD